MASTALLIWVLLTRPQMPRRRDWPLAALCGLLGFTIYNITFNYGETHVTSATAGFMVNIAPIFSMLWAMLWLG